MPPSTQQTKPDLVLSTETFDKIHKTLKELERSTHSELVVFSESNGVPITHAGRLDSVNLPALSSLIAANYSATREMANLVGESEAFKFLYLEGAENNIYLCNTGFEFLLTIVFSRKVALGMIRIYANRAVNELQEILKNAQNKEEEIEKHILDSEFNFLLDSAFDASFNQKSK